MRPAAMRAGGNEEASENERSDDADSAVEARTIRNPQHSAIVAGPQQAE